MVELLKGIAASDGVAVAKAYLLVQPDLSFKQNNVEDTAAVLMTLWRLLLLNWKKFGIKQRKA